MKPISTLACMYLSHFSKPACNRLIYRTIRKNRVSSILELGMDDAKRAENMIRLASRSNGAGVVRYTGIQFLRIQSGFQDRPEVLPPTIEPIRGPDSAGPGRSRPGDSENREFAPANGHAGYFFTMQHIRSGNGLVLRTPHAACRIHCFSSGCRQRPRTIQEAGTA